MIKIHLIWQKYPIANFAWTVFGLIQNGAPLLPRRTVAIALPIKCTQSMTTSADQIAFQNFFHNGLCGITCRYHLGDVFFLVYSISMVKIHSFRWKLLATVDARRLFVDSHQFLPPLFILGSCLFPAIFDFLGIISNP